MESIDLTDFLEAEERDLTLLRLTSFLSLLEELDLFFLTLNIFLSESLETDSRSMELDAWSSGMAPRMCIWLSSSRLRRTACL